MMSTNFSDRPRIFPKDLFGTNLTFKTPTNAPKRCFGAWCMVHGYAQLIASGTLKVETMNGLGVLDAFPQFHDSNPDQIP